MSASLLASSDHRLLADAPFTELEHAAFGFRHRLSELDLFSIAALRGFAGGKKDSGISSHFECGSNELKSGWGSRPQDKTLMDAFDELPSGNSLIMFKSVHLDPAYGDVLQRFLDEVGALADIDMSKRYKRPICTVILASPRRVTPYHIDDAHNLLLQVHGSKAFYVFDGTDPTIVTPAEREAFWSGNQNAAIHTEEKQKKAVLYDLTPGDGVHVPITYPHWVRNGDDVSVAVSINFQPAHTHEAEIHKINRLMRKMGIHPSQPGQNPAIDGSKVAAFRLLSSLKHIPGRRSA